MKHQILTSCRLQLVGLLVKMERNHCFHTHSLCFIICCKGYYEQPDTRSFNRGFGNERAGKPKKIQLKCKKRG
jgi:hypothetical protein